MGICKYDSPSGQSISLVINHGLQILGMSELTEASDSIQKCFNSISISSERLGTPLQAKLVWLEVK